MAGQTPWWVKDGCPSWCVADHRSQLVPGDRVHQGVVVSVPAVQLRRVWSTVTPSTPPEPTRVLVPGVVDVVRYRYAGELEEWVAISGQVGEVDVTVEAARRLLVALGQVLADR